MDFAAAGQDAFSLVPIVCNLGEESGFTVVNLQILAYPVLKSLILIADPAAIKVCLLSVHLITCLSILPYGRSQPIVQDHVSI
jgi:hypothetical protein